MPSSILRGAAFSAVGLMGVCWNLAAQDSVYVEDTIRAQVREGLTLAAAAKASVAAFFLANQAAPANRVAAGMTPNAADSQGEYVASVEIARGEVIVTYGVEAHATLTGKVLVMTPFVTPDQSLAWQCGFATLPITGAAAIDANTSNTSTTVDTEYLPRSCRE